MKMSATQMTINNSKISVKISIATYEKYVAGIASFRLKCGQTVAQIVRSDVLSDAMLALERRKNPMQLGMSEAPKKSKWRETAAEKLEHNPCSDGCVEAALNTINKKLIGCQTYPQLDVSEQ